MIGPTPERNRQANRDLALNAALEMSMWAVEDVEALRTALQMVGANGCLRLCSAVIDALGIEAEPIIGEEDIEPVEAVPDEFEGSMDYHRARGLGEWLEDVVARLP